MYSWQHSEGQSSCISRQLRDQFYRCSGWKTSGRMHLQNSAAVGFYSLVQTTWSRTGQTIHFRSFISKRKSICILQSFSFHLQFNAGLKFNVEFPSVKFWKRIWKIYQHKQLSRFPLEREFAVEKNDCSMTELTVYLLGEKCIKIAHIHCTSRRGEHPHIAVCLSGVISALRLKLLSVCTENKV